MTLHCLWLTPHSFFKKHHGLQQATHFLIEHHLFHSLKQFHAWPQTKFLFLLGEGHEPFFVRQLPLFFPTFKPPLVFIPKEMNQDKQNTAAIQAEFIQGIYHAFCHFFFPQAKKPVLRNKFYIPLPIVSKRHFVPFDQTVLLKPGNTLNEVWLHQVDQKAIRLQMPICWLEAQIAQAFCFFQFRPHFWINLNHLERIERLTQKNHVIYFTNQFSVTIKPFERQRILDQFSLLGQRRNRQFQSKNT